MTVSQFRYAAIVLFSMVIVMACRGIDNEGTSGSSGELTLALTDGPADTIDEFNLYISGVEITDSNGDTVLVEGDDIEEEFFDLVMLRGGIREEIIRNFDLEDGTYDSIRLIVNEVDSNVRVGGSEFDVSIPSGEEANLSLDLNIFFDEDNDEEDFTIDIDLRKSIRADDFDNPTTYFFHPRLRVVETSRTGTVRGTVHPDLITNSQCSSRSGDQDGNAVYLFADNGVVQDLQDNNDDPIATATVDVQSDNSGEFSFGFLPVQTYRAVFTCDAFDDNPAEENSNVDFSSPVDVTVEEGSTATLSFGP